MKIIHQNLKQRTLKVQPENVDDLWHISTVISLGDTISGKTFRKIVLGDKKTENAKTFRKEVFLTILVEKVDFENNLRILGTITSGPEDIPHGDHHSFDVEPMDVISIQKDWLAYEIQKIKDATHTTKQNVLLCIYNREEAIIGTIEKNSINVLATLKGSVAKKVEGSDKGTDFFKELAGHLKEYDTRLNPDYIACGSSHFWKNNVTNELESIKKKIIFATVNDVSEAGFAELLKRPEVRAGMENLTASKDAKLIDELFEKISKDEPVCYSIKDCAIAVDQGAIETLICTENLIISKREDNTFAELENIFKTVESNKGKIHIITGKGEHIAKLDGLTGIAAFLRYKVS